jgi:hypothetical protein
LNGTVEYVFILENDGSELERISGTKTNTSFQVCTIENITTPTITYSLELRYYTGDGNYFYETYNVEEAPTTSLPVTIYLYFLNKTNGIQFKINYVDFNYLIHPGAIIQVQRQYLVEDVYKIVEIPKIGDNGQAVASFSTSNIRYKLIVIENGEIIDTFDNIFPACQNIILGTCELNIRGEEVVETSTIDDFTYTLVRQNDSLILTYIIPSGTPRSVTFFTNQNSRFLSNISTCSSTVFGSGGTITCNYNQTIGDSIIDTQITSTGMNTLYGSVGVSEDLSSFYLLNNYVISFVLLLSLALMFISSGVMLVIVGVVGIMFLGLIFLIRGSDLTTIGSSIMWLIIGAIIIIYKISKKEETT